MSVVNTLSRSGHLSELNSPLVTAEGVLTPAVRKQRVMDNLFGGTIATVGAGTVTTAATTEVTEFIDVSGMRTTILDFTAFAMGDGGDGAALAIGALAYTFPAGNIWFEKASLMGTFGTSVLYTNALDAGIGSVIGSGVQSVLSAVGATSEDFIGSITTAALPTATAVGVSGVVAASGLGDRVIAAAAAHTVHINAAGTWTNIAAAGPVTFTGRAVLNWKLITAS